MAASSFLRSFVRLFVVVENKISCTVNNVQHLPARNYCGVAACLPTVKPDPMLLIQKYYSATERGRAQKKRELKKKHFVRTNAIRRKEREGLGIG